MHNVCIHQKKQKSASLRSRPQSWQAEQRRIKEEANRKRSEAAKEQPRIKTEDGKTIFAVSQVDEQSVHPPERQKEAKERKAKAAASKTNPGAVARGDKLAKERPDLADMVRLGLMKPAEAHRQMKRDRVKAKTCTLPEGKHRVIYADPPWKYNDGRNGDPMTATGALHHYPQRLYGLSAWATPCAQGSLNGA